MISVGLYAKVLLKRQAQEAAICGKQLAWTLGVDFVNNDVGMSSGQVNTNSSLMGVWVIADQI